MRRPPIRLGRLRAVRRLEIAARHQNGVTLVADEFASQPREIRGTADIAGRRFRIRRRAGRSDLVFWNQRGILPTI
jgi:hypothetical protein